MDTLNTLDATPAGAPARAVQKNANLLPPWRPGQTGNPLGSHAVELKLVRLLVKDLARAATPRMLVELCDLAENARASKLVRTVAGAAVLAVLEAPR